jgi:hypothetical protein
MNVLQRRALLLVLLASMGSIISADPEKKAPLTKRSHALRCAGNALGMAVCGSLAVVTFGLFKNSYTDGQRLTKLPLWSKGYNDILRGHIVDVVSCPLFTYLACKFGLKALKHYSALSEKTTQMDDAKTVD